MFQLQERPLLSYLKQLSPTHRFGQVGETTIEMVELPNRQDNPAELREVGSEDEQVLYFLADECAHD